MKIIRSMTNKIFDIFEIYLPTISFFVLFISFIILIAYRYIFHASMDWLFELNIIVFVWTSILAASYGSRTGDHVAFGIVYDKLSDIKKLIFRFIGNTFIIIIFIILLPNAYNTVNFMAMRKSPIMKIPFNYIYLPFMVFVVLTLTHHIIILVKDIKLVMKSLKGKAKI